MDHQKERFSETDGGGVTRKECDEQDINSSFLSSCCAWLFTRKTKNEDVLKLSDGSENRKQYTQKKRDIIIVCLITAVQV